MINFRQKEFFPHRRCIVEPELLPFDRIPRLLKGKQFLHTSWVSEMTKEHLCVEFCGDEGGK